MKRDIKVVALGDLERLPPPVRRALDSMIAATAGNRSMTVALALSYGGRQDVTAAARRIAEEVAAGTAAPLGGRRAGGREPPFHRRPARP